MTAPDVPVERIVRRRRRGKDNRPWRSIRPREVRSRSIGSWKLYRDARANRALYPDEGRQLPATRGDCINGPRPCPYVSCRHHLYLDVAPETGSVKFNFPDLEPWEMPQSCALDVVDRNGPLTLLETGRLVNLTRNRAEQLINRILRKPSLREAAEKVLRDS